MFYAINTIVITTLLIKIYLINRKFLTTKRTKLKNILFLLLVMFRPKLKLVSSIFHICYACWQHKFNFPSYVLLPEKLTKNDVNGIPDKNGSCSFIRKFFSAQNKINQPVIYSPRPLTFFNWLHSLWTKQLKCTRLLV